jgi:hypothetical protein
MSDNMNINTFALRFLRGEFIFSDVKTQCEAGWYDWFCKDTSLAAKTRSLGKKVLQLMKSEKVDPEANYVFFKNNCPMNGPLYDDFRICSLETGDVIYTVVPRSGHTGMAEVWGRDNNFDGPLVTGTWKDVKTFFGV